MCLHSSNNTICHPLQTTEIYSSRQTDDHVSCDCGGGDCGVDGPCSCTWPWLRPGLLVCLRSTAGVKCRVVKMDHDPSSRADLQFDDICTCYRGNCYCNWREIEPNDEVCSLSLGAALCYSVSVRSRCGVASMGVVRGRRATPKEVSCVCGGGDVCTCYWSRVSNRDSICIDDQGQNICLKVLQDSTTQVFDDDRQVCSCSDVRCVCKFGRVVEGAEICLKSASGTTCTNARVLDDVDRNRAKYHYACVCGSGDCKCVWDFMRSIRKVCMVRQQQETCLSIKEEKSTAVRQQGGDCKCLQKKCVCEFETLPKDSKICFHATNVVECIPPPKATQDDELGRAGVAENSLLQQPSLKKCDGIGGEPVRPGVYMCLLAAVIELQEPHSLRKA
ncbi:uncharacterized protein LOC124613431 [Schistocerca americana]|uniref:uncharacterized protein LOC124613431 n=1 Tax=Schistocerca americana TaxID=7009 RepID=UPI001F4F17A6|nr:uncharacterized protein LOC124613431 [Schistocerca americana]